MADDTVRVDLQDVDIGSSRDDRVTVSFYNSEDDNINSDNIGTIDSNSRMRRTGHASGRAEQFLESKGFGWLMETENDETEENKLLL